ncbi:MAG: hypothetical protein J0J04_15730 [Microbacterium sp.]|uniref:hypothetical protein n=1 Tax=Microbacterium sp. TaxID=51671 RepID=UPI001ACFF722|nr:hypothetical protein [Microbacterium sp.]MBN9216225.1 hypothetical protein [Microbacterium sp.]
MDGALRLSPGVLGMEMHAILASPAQFRGLSLADYGFRSINVPTRSQVPTVERLGLDIRDRFNVDIIRDADSPLRARVVGGFLFEDPHPDEWWRAVHDRGAVPVIVGDPGAFLGAPTIGAGVAALAAAGAVVGDMRLVVRMYDTGVGTAAPGQ